MIDSLLLLPAHQRRRLAAALESGMLAFPCTSAGLTSVLGVGGSDDLLNGLGALARSGLTARAAALWLTTLDSALNRVPRPDLVWTGPEVPGLHARDTRRVYEELLGSAKRSLWASTYAFFDGPRAFKILAQRLDERPSLAVTLLLNIQRKRGETTSADQLVVRFAERFWKTDWPGRSAPSVFYDPRSLDPDGPPSVLHAKAVVADDEVVFVTSANLTGAAFDHNIELGLLVRDPALAQSVSQHFRVLIDRGLLSPLPTR